MSDTTAIFLKDVCKILDISPGTVRNWDATGKLKPLGRTKSGRRYYSREQLELFKAKNPRYLFSRTYTDISERYNEAES